jgi:hypothetical protein
LEQQAIVKAHKLLWYHFVEQHHPQEEPSKEIILDFDGTDIQVRCDQPGKFFGRYYDHEYFPL